MKKVYLLILFMTAVCCVSLDTLAQSPGNDSEGCRDYPLFNRMPNYHIDECESIEFDARNFPAGDPDEDRKTRQVRVEGALTFLRYVANEGSTPASGLQIMRNFENAAKSGGGTVEGSYPDWCSANVEYDSRLGNTCTYWGVSMKFDVSGKEVWAFMNMIDDTSYGIQIIERESMKQDIVVNAAELQKGLASTGHMAVYDILFDIGKSELKPASEGSLREIAMLLSQDPSLNLHVVGHTDNVGDAELNMKLSLARAGAVVDALVNQHAVAAARLDSFGAGPYAPVASNRTEEGRAKNRRVELVEQ